MARLAALDYLARVTWLILVGAALVSLGMAVVVLGLHWLSVGRRLHRLLNSLETARAELAELERLVDRKPIGQPGHRNSVYRRTAG